MASNRMTAFDKCVDELMNAVTRDMIHPDNLKADVKKHMNTNIGSKRYPRLEEIRGRVLGQFKVNVRNSINGTLKEKLQLQQCFDDLNKPELKQKNAWRINGDPQHDTFAQRRPVYLEYIGKLQGAEKQLEEEFEKMKAELMSK